ncbi:MAG: hypothetical protein ACE5Q6_04350 [Dehalococcoidia bacterium]
MSFVGIKFWLILAVVAVLGIGSGTALAHEDRETGGLNFVVGFIIEPAFEGFQNGVSLRVTKPAEAQHDEGTTHGHGEVSLDVEEHGALFSSSGLNHDQTFTFEVGHELENLTIPYHSHIDHGLTGTITVSESADLSGMVDIRIMDGGFQPADITVQPGTRLMWTNHGDTPQSVASGVVPGADPEDEHSEMVMVPVEGLESALQVEVTHVPSQTSKVMELRTVFGEPGHYTADLIPTAPGQYTFRFFGTVDGEELDETFESGPGRFNDVQVAADLQFPEAVPAVREIEGAVRGAQTSSQQAQDSATSARTLGIIGIFLGVVGTLSGVGGVVVGLRKG